MKKQPICWPSPAEAFAWRSSGPERMPLSLSLAHFDEHRARLYQEQLDIFGYQGPLPYAGQAIRTRLPTGRIDHSVLELGVGTGLCGPLLRDVAAHLTGVDISGAYAGRGDETPGRRRQKNLRRADQARAHAIPCAKCADGVLRYRHGGANLFGYIGDVRMALSYKVARAEKPGGLFAFTADAVAGGEMADSASIPP